MLIFRKAETFWGKQFYFSVFTFDFEEFLPPQAMKKHFLVLVIALILIKYAILF
jgi:hypothetical protein